jgi:hypothetical protein
MGRTGREMTDSSDIGPSAELSPPGRWPRRLPWPRNLTSAVDGSGVAASVVVCDGTCGNAAGWRPGRIQTNRAARNTKSDAGRRVVGLPPALVEFLREHRSEQERWRGPPVSWASRSGQ